jgi:hypothetical protein
MGPLQGDALIKFDKSSGFKSQRFQFSEEKEIAITSSGIFAAFARAA